MERLRSVFRDPRLYPAWLILLVGAAIWLRLPFLHQLGFDDPFFRSWGDKIATSGLQNVYIAPNIPNYPPFYLYLLTPLTWISTHLLHTDPLTSQTFITVQKSFNLIVDCADGLLLFAIVRSRFSFWGSFGLSALFLLNPYIPYDSVVWGQVDGLLSLFMLASLLCLQKGRPAMAMAMGVLGLLTKAQFVIFLPLLLLYILMMHGWKRAFMSVLWAVALGILVLLPFAASGSLPALYREAYSTAAGYFPYLSLNAHNLWWLWVDPGDIFSNSDATPVIFGLTANKIGDILFIAAYLVAIWSMLRRRSVELADLALAAGFSYLAFYCLNTEMHERYLYPFFAMWLAGYRKSWAWWLPFVVLSVTQLLSLMLMLPLVPGYNWVRYFWYPRATYPLTYANLTVLIGLIAYLITSDGSRPRTPYSR